MESDEELIKQGYLHPQIVRAQRERREREKNTIPRFPDLSIKMFTDHKYDWIECDHCWLIADHPQKICNGCVHNDQVIKRLKARIVSLEGHLAKYRKRQLRRKSV